MEWFPVNTVSEEFKYKRADLYIKGKQTKKTTHIYLLIFTKEREDKPKNNDLGYLQGVGNGMDMGEAADTIFFIVWVWEAC